MKKHLFYDCEIAKCIPSQYEDNDPQFEYCEGWHDFPGMGIAVIGCYADWLDQYFTFEAHQLAEFNALVEQADEIVGFNSVSFDDNLMHANGLDICTTIDVLARVRMAAGMPPYYVPGVTRAGYSLKAIAGANLDFNKTGSGELAPQLWQLGRKDEVKNYCINDVMLLVALWKLPIIIDPTDGSELNIHEVDSEADTEILESNIFIEIPAL